MDLQNVKALSGLVFSYVPASPRFGGVRVYYDIESHFPTNRFEMVDLSGLTLSGNTSHEMFFRGSPVRARYIRIVLQEYPENPPCIIVAPILCAYYCEGCCEALQSIDVSALAVLPIISNSSEANVNVWHTAENMCECLATDVQWFLTSVGNFTDVEQICRDKHAVIATINSAEENQAVDSLCTTSTCFIGYVRAVPNSPWFWSSKSPILYVNWNSNEGFSSKETKTVILNTGKWADWGTGLHTMPGVCRRDATFTLCPCSIEKQHTNAFGVALRNVTVEPLQHARIISYVQLPETYTHILRPNGGEKLRHNDHIFARKPHPPAQQPFFQMSVSAARRELDGEFLQADSTSAMVVNRFQELDKVAILYKDIHVRTKNEWRAIDLETQQNNFGPGGTGFVQRILMDEQWYPGIAIHLTPNVGIHIPYSLHRNDTYTAGMPVHMTVFVSNKKLNTSSASTDWDWIRCGAMTQTPIVFPPKYMTSSILLADRYSHGPHSLINSADTTVVPTILPSLGDVFHTAFASANLWTSQGGFLPDPPVCWLSSEMSVDALLAQAPMGGVIATEPSNPACRLGQLTFPGPALAAIKAGYVRCDLGTDLRTAQVLPCMYTLGDVLRRYAVSDADLELSGDFKSVYQLSNESNATIHNKRNGDIFTQKVAFGNRQDTDNRGSPLFVCHPQFNNQPMSLASETTILRPDISCSIPRGGRSHAMMTDCVCGIIARTYTKAVTGDTFDVKIVRIIPQTELGRGKASVPSHGFVTEMADEALAIADVLSIGTMTETSSSQTLPRVYFASDPSTVHNDATIPSLPAEYDICREHTDPDNKESMNLANPHILDGIVIPLGATFTPDTQESDCCNFLRPSVSIFALYNNNQSKSSIAYVRGGTHSARGFYSDLWFRTPAVCREERNYSSGWSSQNDQNQYPCVSTVALSTSSNVQITPHTPVAPLYILHKMYVKTRGWLLVHFSSTSHRCSEKTDASVDTVQQCRDSTLNARNNVEYDWQVQHIPASYDLHANGSFSTDAIHLWKVGDVIFGGVEGVGTCTERCPSSGAYDNVGGHIKWVPRIDAPNEKNSILSFDNFWLYTVFSVGESPACQNFNCDEAAHLRQHSQNYFDDPTLERSHHSLTFFEGTSIVAFVSRSSIVHMKPGCMKLSGGGGADSNTGNYGNTQKWYDRTTNTISLHFQLSVALIGTQRITDFAFCSGCTHDLCRNSAIIPCRWQSSIDSTWWYYMHLYLPNVDRNPDSVVMRFRVLRSEVQDSEYSDETVFLGHFVAGPGASFSDEFLGDGMDAVAFVAFTSVERQCANNLPSGNWDTGRALNTRRLLLSTRAIARPRMHHGRRIHARLYRPGHRQHAITAETLRPNAAPIKYDSNIARNSSHHLKHNDAEQKHGSKRFLLSINTAPTHSALGLENTTQNNGMMRSITSIDSNQRVAAAVCLQNPSMASTCDTLEVRKEIPLDSFCLDEAAFMLHVAPGIREELLSVSSTNVSGIVITSIAREDFDRKCVARQAYDALSLDYVHITYVAILSDVSFFDTDGLSALGYLNVRHLTTTSSSKLSLCASSQQRTNTVHNVTNESDAEMTKCARRLQYSMTRAESAIQSRNQAVLETIPNVFQTHFSALITGISVLGLFVFIFFGFCWTCPRNDRDTQEYDYRGVRQDDYNHVDRRFLGL
jgi:hypothetical protein